MSHLANAFALVVALMAVHGGSAEPADIVIRAADLSQAALNGAWTLESDSTSPGGLRVTATAGEDQASDAPMSAPRSYFDALFYAEAHVPYRVWLHIAPGGEFASGTSVWVQFSDAQVAEVPAYGVGTHRGLLVAVEPCAGCPDSGWSWRGSSEYLAQHPVITFRASGLHRLRVQVRDGAVRLDQIVLSPKNYLIAPPAAGEGDRTTN